MLIRNLCTRFNSIFQLKRVPVVSMQIFFATGELIQFIKSCYCHVKTKLSDEVCSCFNLIKTDSRHKQVFFMLLFLCYIINGSSFSKFWHCAFFNFTSLMVPHSSERIICLRVFINVSIFVFAL